MNTRVSMHRAAAFAAAAAILGLTAHTYDIVHRSGVLEQGNLTISQVLKRAEPLCGALSRSARSLRISAAPAFEGGRLSPHSKRWTIDAYDANGAFCAHLTLDSDTGEVITASSATRPVAKGSKPITRVDAIRLAESWACTLGMPQPEDDRAGVSAGRLRSSWCVRWRLGKRSVEVTESAFDGELRMASYCKYIR